MEIFDETKMKNALASPLTDPPCNPWERVSCPAIRHIEETGSTNEDVKAFARENDSPFVLIADRQNAGKGRFGRSFFSESGLFMSVLLPDPDQALPFLTHLTAVAVAEAIRALTKENAEIKWVNDIFVRGKKVCGILCESVVIREKRSYIAGIGVNIGQPKEGFPADIAKTAGWIECDKTILASEIIKRLFYEVSFFDEEELKKKYRELMFLIGKSVSVVKNDKEEPAVVCGLTQDLGLSVRFSDGRVAELRSGEVRLKLT